MPIEGEIEAELNIFLSEARDTLAIEETPNAELYRFLSSYMIPTRTGEYREDLWAEVEEVVEGNLEEPQVNHCEACQGPRPTMRCSGCEKKFHESCMASVKEKEIEEEVEEYEEENSRLCKECSE